MISTIMMTVMIGMTINYQWYYHLKPLLSFPGEVDRVSSIGKAGVLILFYVRHLMRVEVSIPRCWWSQWQLWFYNGQKWWSGLVSFLPLLEMPAPVPSRALCQSNPSVRNSIKLCRPNKRTGKQTNKTLESCNRKQSAPVEFDQTLAVDVIRFFSSECSEAFMIAAYLCGGPFTKPEW